MRDERLNEALLHPLVRGRSNRRTLLARAVALGAAPVAMTIGGALGPISAFAQDALLLRHPARRIPLGVDPAAPLDVFIFKGGYGDDYAINVNTMYNKLFPDAKITYTGTQKLGAQLQPRFIDGSPPDVIDNSGADNLDNTALVAEGQLADLSDLMAAVSYDTEGSTFADTLVPGSQDSGVYDGKQQVLNYALSVYGIWYSSSFMETNGYTYPKTWTDFIALCEQIKASGIAPFITTGVYPQYLQLFMFDSMLWKHGGVDVINKIDNLEDDAWRQPEVKTVLEALYQLADGGYFAEGWEGLTHTESQGEWLQGKAAFLPCGSWLENEMKGLIPDGFDMVVAPTPSLDEDKVPFEGISSDAGEGFIVPDRWQERAGRQGMGPSPLLEGRRPLLLGEHQVAHGRQWRRRGTRSWFGLQVDPGCDHRVGRSDLCCPLWWVVQGSDGRGQAGDGGSDAEEDLRRRLHQHRPGCGRYRQGR